MRPRLAALLLTTLLAAGCGPRKSSPAPSSSAGTAAIATKYQYVVADGGPHILITTEGTGSWSGHKMNLKNPADPGTDYGRALSIKGKWDIISAGSHSALIIADPSYTACRAKGDPGPPDLFVIQYLAAGSIDPDASIDRALASTPATSFTDTGKTLSFGTSGGRLYFAGDDPAAPTYDVAEFQIRAGTYALQTASYKGPGDEEVDIYRFVPAPSGSAP